MNRLESERLILRPLEASDFNDFWDLSKNWKEAPGPAFDKWPVAESDCKKAFEHFRNSQGIFWIYLRGEAKIIGGIFLNNIDENGFIDMGHVIHSSCQNNDIDREALSMAVGNIFKTMDVIGIITNNDPDEKQNAPLYGIGFTDRNANGGQLILKKATHEG